MDRRKRLERDTIVARKMERGRIFYKVGWKGQFEREACWVSH
jgi:hypothetical protein